MVDRADIGEVALAGVLATPIMAIPLTVAGEKLTDLARLRSLAGPYVLCIVLLLIPTIFANVVARILVGWLGGGLTETAFHLVTGLFACGLLIFIIDSVSRGMRELGGGPLSKPLLRALLLAGACNLGMIHAVRHLG